MTLVYDSHCHLNSVLYNNEDYQRPRLVVAINHLEWEQLFKIRNYHPEYKIALGIHPWEVNNYSEHIIRILENNIIKYSPDCIGEIGLDKLKSNFAYQLKIFELQLQLAKKYNLGVIIHCVKAYNEAISLLKKHNIHKGVFHAYNANQIIANNITKLGLYLGIGGLISKPTLINKNILNINIEHIILESDAPYMPYLGNSVSVSSDCDKYATLLATYYNIDVVKVVQISNNNFLNLFRK